MSKSSHHIFGWCKHFGEDLDGIDPWIGDSSRKPKYEVNCRSCCGFARHPSIKWGWLSSQFSLVSLRLSMYSRPRYCVPTDELFLIFSGFWFSVLNRREAKYDNLIYGSL